MEAFKYKYEYFLFPAPYGETTLLVISLDTGATIETKDFDNQRMAREYFKRNYT